MKKQKFIPLMISVLDFIHRDEKEIGKSKRRKLGAEYSNLSFIIDYPIEKKVEVIVPIAKSVYDILNPIAKKYAEIYSDEENSYGVRLHGIEDLYFEGISIDELNGNEILIGS